MLNLSYLKTEKEVVDFFSFHEVFSQETTETCSIGHISKCTSTYNTMDQQKTQDETSAMPQLVQICKQMVEHKVYIHQTLHQSPDASMVQQNMVNMEEQNILILLMLLH